MRSSGREKLIGRGRWDYRSRVLQFLYIPISQTVTVYHSGLGRGEKRNKHGRSGSVQFSHWWRVVKITTLRG